MRQVVGKTHVGDVNVLVFLSADSKDGDYFLESWRYMRAAGLVHIATIHVASRNLDM